MPSYVDHLVDKNWPTCPSCEYSNLKQACVVPDETVLRFTCPRCGTDYRAKAEVQIVWSTFRLDEDDDDIASSGMPQEEGGNA
ncbi:hypothetical protein [Modicisalibacter sp. MOD 31.J]|uniref:hypothetical protein n=1 Tax=Modicisalibacter sp. MOD 31.J TaxID=2831897 RepID=UPI001CD015FD|nr:hypothetical protein [Modicisalibacter sp. MOD 31.J]MBZ9574524.1 hypothetical protein [Modicisalibacter sp. MOD 31.J]